MKKITPEELKPSAMSLMLIRQIAYTYRVSKHTGLPVNLCMN